MTLLIEPLPLNRFAMGSLPSSEGGEGGRGGGQHIKRKEKMFQKAKCMPLTTKRHGYYYRRRLSPCSTKKPSTNSSPRASRVQNPSNASRQSPQVGRQQSSRDKHPRKTKQKNVPEILHNTAQNKKHATDADPHKRRYIKKQNTRTATIQKGENK